MSGLSVQPLSMIYLSSCEGTARFQAVEFGLICPDHPTLVQLMPAGLKPTAFAP